MTDNEFRLLLEAAVCGDREALDSLLALYMPLINRLSSYAGNLDEDCRQYITQDWKIDCNGTFLEALNECVEVTHYPDEMDIWSCSNCDFSAEGKSFLVNSHS